MNADERLLKGVLGVSPIAKLDSQEIQDEVLIPAEEDIEAVKVRIAVPF